MNPDVIAYNDYFPFGMLVPTRHNNANIYRYGFQGQEKDNEIKGIGNSINYKFRMYDPRVGRFFAVDPLAEKYPWNSPYAFSENVVINAVELEGLEKYYTNDNKFLGQVGDDQSKRIMRNIASGTDEAKNISSQISVINEISSSSVGVTDYGARVYHNLKNDLLKHSISKKTFNEFNQAITSIYDMESKGASLLSIPQGVVEHFGGLDKMTKLINEGKFQVMYNGIKKTYSLKFYGNQSISKEFIKLEKLKFLSKASQNSEILSIVKSGGIVLSLFSAGVSIHQYLHGDINGYELTGDMFFTAVAIYGGPVGFIASTVYFAGKMVFKEPKTYFHSDVGGYDISHQNMMHHPYFVPKK